MRKIVRSSLKGVINPPPSKSITHRALILAGTSQQGSQITNLLNSSDTNATKEAIIRMGAEFNHIQNGLELVYPVDRGGSIINCENSGTTLRLLTGLSAIFEEETTLFGDESLNSRPMMPLIEALRQLGADITDTDGHAPVTVNAPVRNYNRNCEIRGDLSSQFISSLLIMASLRGEDIETEINIIPPVISQPYLDLTLEMLEYMGTEITRGEQSFTVTGKSNFERFDLVVPADYSSAAFFVGAGAIPGNEIVIQGMNNIFTQADAAILDIMKEAGADIERVEQQIHVSSKGIEGFNADVGDCPDLFPILCVVAACADGETVISGAEHLKYKETNRIEAMQEVLVANNIEFIPTDDGAIIQGGKPTGGTTVDSQGDHRIAMAAAILGTKCRDQLLIENSEVVEVSYPNFFKDLEQLTIEKKRR